MKPGSTNSMILLAVAVFGLLIASAVWQNYKPSPYDAFAQCLTDQGAVMYGASWCPHCLTQKDLFGSAWKNVNYVECAVENGTRNLDLCPEIEAVPHWQDADGEYVGGGMSLESLAEIFSCELPE